MRHEGRLTWIVCGYCKNGSYNTDNFAKDGFEYICRSCEKKKHEALKKLMLQNDKKCYCCQKTESEIELHEIEGEYICVECCKKIEDHIRRNAESRLKS